MHDRLYASALELFAEQGYDRTTIDQITERADVARGTFFNHFQRKEDLVTTWGQQRQEKLIDVWTTEEGLKDSSVTSIAQTPEGYLWVGTYNGLTRFDGVRFVTFDPDNTPELLHARIRRILADVWGLGFDPGTSPFGFWNAPLSYTTKLESF